MKRPTRALAALALTAGLAATALTPATAAAPERLVLGDLPRGAAPAVPYLEHDTIVDGAIRLDAPRNSGGLLGKVGEDYLVWAFASGSLQNRIVRISPSDGTTTLLRAETLYDAVLSPDGTTIASSVIRTNGRSVVRLFDASTGELTQRRALRGFASVLDYDGARAVIGLNSPDRTVVWTPASDAVTTLVADTGYRADLELDRLAVFTGDPFRRGCTEVSTLSDPTTRLWRSCTERVEAWSTDGSRIAAVDLLSDGLGPGRVSLRTTRGRLLGTYDAPYYFGRLSFEDATHLLMDTYSKRRYAIVRCDGSGDCERAGRRHAHVAPLHATRVPGAP